MNKLLSIIGPTASGKTSLAVSLAKKFDGELINADSRQVYKYLDIGTAKGRLDPDKSFLPKAVKLDKKKYFIQVYEIESVPIHLVNILNPDEVLTLAHYQKLAYMTINDIKQRDRTPILVGGTGLYIDALIKGYNIPKVKPDKQLRARLNKLSLKQLQKKLKSLSSSRFENLNRSDKHNPHRLVRLIEIEKANKHTNTKSKSFPELDVLMLKPQLTHKQLFNRIKKRAEKIVGYRLFREVQNLINKNYNFSNPALTSLGYDLVRDFLKGKLDKDKLIDSLILTHRQYAKRQRTWFKRYEAVEVKSLKQAEREVKNWLL